MFEKLKNSDHGLIWFMNVSIVRKIKKKMKRLKMRYIPTVVVAFSCDFVVANPILIKKKYPMEYWISHLSRIAKKVQFLS